MNNRPRRLRRTAQLRNLVAETRVSKDSLIYPLFVTAKRDAKDEISAMPGQYHWGVDRLPELLDRLAALGVKSLLFFGLPDHKDEIGSSSWDENGPVQQALRCARFRHPEMTLIADVCLCEYTSHGHCGCLKQDDRGSWTVDNDATLPLLARAALSLLDAGADAAAPSDMMDGRVAALRQEMDRQGFLDRAIFSYAAKFASSFYGPFRQAAGSAPAVGDRKSYQMDPRNGREAIKEALLDEDEGADVLIVKPGLAYLDVVARLRERTDLPIASYWVSGEYSMIKAAAARGWIDERSVTCEAATSIIRAGAGMIITYSAPELAGWIDEGFLR